VFFEPAGPDTFVATPATAGPWSAQAQHGGPPSALAARAMERHEPDSRQRLARVTADILRPIPVGKVALRTRVLRPGRRVALLETIMESDGQEVLHARGWRIEINVGEVPAPAVVRPPVLSEPLPSEPPVLSEPPPVPPPQPPPGFPGGYIDGYISAIDWRFVSGGGFVTPGPARVWARPRIPLVPGEELTPMCSALLVADSGSGVSRVLDPARFLFINTDLTVVLTRDPAGDWLLLDAATAIGDQGSGVAETALSDTRGPCGRALQTLLIAPR
jgi:Thioesterase-like superfamily